MSHHRCCCSGVCVGSITVNVKGCDGATPVVGATVTVKIGATTIASGTTDSLGQYIATGLAAATYTVSVSKTRYTTYTTTVVLSCPSNQNPVVNVAYTAGTGYVCCAHCPNPVPATLAATFGGVSFSFTYSSGQWVGASNSGTINASDCVGTVNIRGQLSLLLTCPATDNGPWTLTGSLQGTCTAGVGCTIYRGGSTLGCSWGFTATSASGLCGLPLSLSFTIPGAWSFSGCSPYGECGPITLPSGTFPITE